MNKDILEFVTRHACEARGLRGGCNPNKDVDQLCPRCRHAYDELEHLLVVRGANLDRIVASWKAEEALWIEETAGLRARIAEIEK